MVLFTFSDGKYQRKIIAVANAFAHASVDANAGTSGNGLVGSIYIERLRLQSRFLPLMLAVTQYE